MVHDYNGNFPLALSVRGCSGHVKFLEQGVVSGVVLVRGGQELFDGLVPSQFTGILWIDRHLFRIVIVIAVKHCAPVAPMSLLQVTHLFQRPAGACWFRLDCRFGCGSAATGGSGFFPKESRNSVANTPRLRQNDLLFHGSTERKGGKDGGKESSDG